MIINHIFIHALLKNREKKVLPVKKHLPFFNLFPPEKYLKLHLGVMIK
jgi:hypothetical protein